MAVTNLRDICIEIVNVIQTIPGIRSVPEEPPESTELYPFVLVHPDSGLYEIGKPIGYEQALYNITIELHVARKDLPRNFTTVMNLIDEIPIELGKAVKASSFTNFKKFEQIEFTFGSMSWGGVDTIGARYLISGIKVQEELV